MHSAHDGPQTAPQSLIAGCKIGCTVLARKANWRVVGDGV